MEVNIESALFGLLYRDSFLHTDAARSIFIQFFSTLMVFSVIFVFCSLNLDKIFFEKLVQIYNSIAKALNCHQQNSDRTTMEIIFIKICALVCDFFPHF